MKPCFYILFWLFIALSTQAQTIYKEYEVDSVARPIGGLPMLEKFINVNRRMPYAAEVNRTNGVVILTTIVEPNGTISDVRTLRSLRPDCDREAIRVLSLFNAWKPALKNGQPVRQQLTYTVRFTPNGWDCQPDRLIRYFNAKGDLTTDASKARYSLNVPVDSLGYPNADPVIYQKAGKKWKEFERLQLKKEAFIHYNNDDPALPDSVDAYRLKIVDGKGASQDIHYSFLTDGTLLATEPYSDGRHVQSSVYYYRNGMVKRIEENTVARTFQQWNWYPSGSLRHVSRHNLAAELSDDEIISQWDSAGAPTVIDGTGIATKVSRMDGQVFLESGPLKAALKTGEWTGRFKSGALVYRETYENSKFISGKHYEANGDLITYHEPNTPAEFEGGMTGLGKFLATNLRYPAEAAQAGIEGRVTVSFVVDTEGNVDDLKVLKEIGYGTSEEAMRVLKATSGKWKPAIQQGRKVKVRYVIPIFFAGKRILVLVN
ncbi:energy transducer TonB [Larkinella terrae]|uniref:TonB family protein n=1 Tax=Larkinella terrae TaxID=2025311 RepID=A0A7K0EQ25_9BACT|nr:energy transducer TonB [Larkinella terrae]MRS63586.1 TonB family protein [Larkinella terrae]